MKRFLRQSLLLVLVFVLALCLLPTASMASLANPLLITPGDSITKDQYGKEYYTFTLQKPSEVKFYLSSTGMVSPGSKTANFGSLKLSYDGGWLTNVDGESTFYVSGDGNYGPGSRAVVYKLAPGAYTIQLAAQNNVTLLFASVTPMVEDTGGEPNDSWNTINKIKLGKAVRGNLFYRGGTYPWARPLDESDYYKFTTTKDNVTIKLTAKRMDTGRSNNFKVQLRTNYEKTSYRIYNLNLTNKPSGTLKVKAPKKGTHAIIVSPASAMRGGCLPTEYEFTVEQQGTAKVTGVAISKKKATVKKGNTLALKATVKPSDAKNKTVTWKSSNKKIATVTSKGVVKGIRKGKATITVTTRDGKKTAKCAVTVK